MTKASMSPSEHGPEIARIPQELATHVGPLPLGAGIREPISAIERPIDPVIANTMKSAWWSSLRKQIAEFSLDPEAAHKIYEWYAQTVVRRNRQPVAEAGFDERYFREKSKDQ